MTVRIPIRRTRRTFADAALDDVLEVDHTQDEVVAATTRGVPPPDATRLHRSLTPLGIDRRCSTNPWIASGAPLRTWVPPMSTPLMRVCAGRE